MKTFIIIAIIANLCVIYAMWTAPVYDEKTDTFTYNKKDFKKHLLTRKHTIADFELKKSLEAQKNPKKTNYGCICGKMYNDNSGLWRHKKKCNQYLNLSPTNIQHINPQILMDFFERLSEVFVV